MEERSADPILQHGTGRTSGKSRIIKVTVQPGGHRMKLRIWSSTLEVKQEIRKVCSVPVPWMRLHHNNVELLNSQLLIDLVPNVKQSRRGGSDASRDSSSASRTLTFWLKVQNPNDFDSGCYLHPWGIGTNAAGAAGERLLASAQQGLQIGLAPQLSLEGSGGTYLLRDTQKRPVAAFKPRDEEPFAPNNPRGFAGKMGQAGIHPHVASGDAHIREVLAFRLDWDGFASVPCTLQVEGRHPAFHVNSLQPLSRYGAKVGSLQAWVEYDDIASDRGPATFPVHEVHKIAILDMRLLNTDRNDSNVLVVDRDKSRGGLQLVPIDHGGCLPSSPAVSWFDWCWLSWPQLKVPLSASDAAYVAKLDVAAEMKLLFELGVPARPRRALYCSTMLLQRGVAAGLSLLDVASLMCRGGRGDEDDVPSELERLWTQAERLACSVLHNRRLRGCSDAYSISTVASTTAVPDSISPPTAATAEDGDDDVSATPPLPRRTSSSDVVASANSPLRSPKSSPIASPKNSPLRSSKNSPKPRAKADERWSESAMSQLQSAKGAEPSASSPSTKQQAAALTGIKRVISTSTLMDIASYSTSAETRDTAHGIADDVAPPYVRRLSAACEEPGGRMLEGTFLAYFERMLDDMIERHVSRRDREQPAAPPEAKSPRTSQLPLENEVP